MDTTVEKQTRHEKEKLCFYCHVTTVLFAKMNSWDARCKVQNHCPMPGA
jgi:hypothetical protein